MNRGRRLVSDDGYIPGIKVTENNGVVTSDLADHTEVNLSERRGSRFGMQKQLDLRDKKKLQRLVQKNGVCNVLHCNVPRRGDFLRDGFTTLLDLQWRWVLVIFSFVYVIGWVIFAGFWFALAWDHGDLDYRLRNDGWEPCVVNVDNFVGAFLFSVETQTTIGYGSRSVTEACWMGGLMVVIQSVFSCLVDAVMIGCVFAKLARPKKRAATIKFSKNACIAERDGKLCFMFRVGDVRQSHIYDAKIRAELVRPHVTEEGECIPIANFKLKLGSHGLTEEQIFLVWPVIISHDIDEESPLYDVSASSLETASFEIIVILEGVLEQTGLIMQARTSYLPDEILWGHRFSSQLMLPHDDQEHLVVDYKQFNAVYMVQSSLLYSAKERDLVEEQGLDVHDINPQSLRSVLKKSYSFETRQRLKRLNGGGDSPRFSNGKGSITFLDEVEEFVPTSDDEEEEEDGGMVVFIDDEHNKDVGFSESVEETNDGDSLDMDFHGSVV